MSALARHVSPDCAPQCRLLKLSVPIVYATIESAQIPLVRIRRHVSNGQMDVKYVKGSQSRCLRCRLSQVYSLGSLAADVISFRIVPDSQPFVAFSHVWRQGLGSTTEEGLFSCRMQRLWDALALRHDPWHDEQGKKNSAILSKAYKGWQCLLVAGG